MHVVQWRARARCTGARRARARTERTEQLGAWGCSSANNGRCVVEQRQQQGQGLRSVTPSPHAAGAQRLTQLRVGPRVPSQCAAHGL